MICGIIIDDDGKRRHIELGVRGVPDQVAAAIAELKTGVTALGGKWEEPRLEG